MNNVMIWLDGNKTYLGAIATPIIAFAVVLGLDAKLGASLITLVGFICGGSKVVIKRAVANETALGVAIVNSRLNK